MEVDFAKIDKMIAKYGRERSSLIQVLHDLQEEYKYLPRKALEYLSEQLKVPMSRTYHVATFYNAFSLQPQGRHAVSVCLGTACHVHQSERLAEALARTLGLPDSEGTSPDGEITLKKVRCLGCCSMAPVVKIDDTLHGAMTHRKAAQAIAALRKA